MNANATKHTPMIIFGSARADGHTAQAVRDVTEQWAMDIPVVNLDQCQVDPFSYAHDQRDDFADVIDQLIEHDLVILATPVYWYSVSAQMKSFIDRLSDLLIVNKDLGRQLRGKHMAVIASYNNDPEGIDGFERPLVNLAQYLGMHFLCTYFHYSGDEPSGKKTSEASLQYFLNMVQGGQ